MAVRPPKRTPKVRHTPLATKVEAAAAFPACVSCGLQDKLVSSKPGCKCLLCAACTRGGNCMHQCAACGDDLEAGSVKIGKCKCRLCPACSKEPPSCERVCRAVCSECNCWTGHASGLRGALTAKSFATEHGMRLCGWRDSESGRTPDTAYCLECWETFPGSVCHHCRRIYPEPAGDRWTRKRCPNCSRGVSGDEENDASDGEEDGSEQEEEEEEDW